jgi:hypothetical protein
VGKTKELTHVAVAILKLPRHATGEPRRRFLCLFLTLIPTAAPDCAGQRAIKDLQLALSTPPPAIPRDWRI